MTSWQQKIVRWLCGAITGHAGSVQRDPTGNINHKCVTCGRWAVTYSAGLRDIVETVYAFDWLKDYGPYWEPGSTAFWLEPETDEQMLSWLAKYGQGLSGTFEFNGQKIEVLPLKDKPKPTYTYPYQYGSVFDYMLTDEEWEKQYRIRG